MTPTERLRETANRLNVRQWADIILNDPRFPDWSGSSSPQTHHYGRGGLAKHVLEVAELCLLTNDYFNKAANEQRLFLAVLFHDAGKMWDYAPSSPDMSEWQGTLHKRRIHHVSRSALVWSETVVKMPLDASDEVLHAILSHHGRREWGSPVGPATKLAWILHLCDGISARVDDCEKHDQFA